MKRPNSSRVLLGKEALDGEHSRSRMKPLKFPNNPLKNCKDLKPLFNPFKPL